MTRHPSATALAYYLEGVVTRPPATRITDHMNGCPQCARLILDLAAVCVMLANVKAPPIPQVVADRLQAALAEESVQRAARAHSGARQRRAASARRTSATRST
jgi:predicted anti-sigma-YlaC factor YlaD